MDDLRILLAGSSAWTTNHIRRLHQIPYAVVEAGTWAGTEWPADWRHFDLVVAEGEVWLAHEADTFPTSYPPVLLVCRYSREAHGRVLNAGAIYVEERAGSDVLVRKIDRSLRDAGRLPKLGRVLVVDNDRGVLEALRRRLAQEGYEVYCALGRQEALELIDDYRPHVAIVDFALHDQNPPVTSGSFEALDQRGYELILELGARYGYAMRVIGLTAHQRQNTPQMAAGNVMAAFVPKNERYVREIIPKVAEAYETLQINNALKLRCKQPLSLMMLVNMMKVYSDQSLEERQRTVTELEELLRKCFRSESEVKGYYMSPGRGGSGVVLMRPTVHGIRANHLVIKFGPRENVRIELENYKNFVQPFIVNRSYLIDITDRPIETHNLGALKFSLVGESDKSPVDFNTFYRDTSATNGEVRHIFKQLFTTTCAKWFEGKREWNRQEPAALAGAYERQLGLNEEEGWQPQTEALHEIATGDVFLHSSFVLAGEETLSVSIHDTILTLPNPLAFVVANRDNFPAPRWSSITHGDLNGRNVFVNPDGKVWLIDFFKTGWGPILRDFGELESVISFELLHTNNFAALLEFEMARFGPAAFDHGIELTDRFKLGEMQKAVQAIQDLRFLALKINELTDMYEYYVGLLYYALKMLTWEGISSSDRERRRVRQRHALLSAALIAYRLEQWSAWPGWPHRQ